MILVTRPSFLQLIGKWTGKTRARRLIFISMLVPGLGHYDLGYRKEAVILLGIAGAITASGAVFQSIFLLLAAPVFWLAQGVDAARLARMEEKTIADAKMESEKTWWD